MIFDFRQYLCDAEFASVVCPLLLLGALTMHCLWSLVSHSRKQSRLEAARERLSSARRACDVQGQCHLRETESVKAEIEHIEGSIEAVVAEKCATMEIMARLENRRVELQNRNKQIAQRADEEIQAIEQQVACYQAHREGILADVATLKEAAHTLTKENVVLEDELIRAHDEYFADTQRVQETLMAATTELKAMDAVDDLSDSSSSAGSVVRLRDMSPEERKKVAHESLNHAIQSAMDLEAEYARLKGANDYLCAEVGRVWNEEIEALEYKIVENGKELSSRSETLETMNLRDELMDEAEVLAEEIKETTEDVIECRRALSASPQ